MILTLVGRLTQFVIMFASVKIMTTLLPPIEMGKASLLVTGIAFFAMFLVNPLGMFINRRLHAWVEMGVFRHYFHVYCSYLLVVAIIAACLAWGGTRLGLLLLNMEGGELALLVGGSLLFNTINQTLVPSLNMVGRSKPFVLLTIATLGLGLVVSAWLVLTLRPTAELWLAGTLVSQILISVAAYFVFFSLRASPRMGFSGAPQVRRLFDFCWPVALAAGMNWAQMQGYRFLLAERVGLAELGMFAAGYGLAASLMAAMETVLTTWFQPKFYRQANASDRETRASAWQKYAAIMLPSSMLGFSALVASAPYLTVIMLGPAYQDSWRYVMLGALAEWTRVLVGLFGLIAHLGMNTRTLILPNLIGCSVTYAILLWLQPKFGLDAAPVSVAVGGFVVAAYLYFDSRNSDYLIKIDWNGLLKTFIFISLMMLVIAQARPWIVKIGSSSAPYLGVALISTLWGVFAFWMLYQNRVQQHSKG